MCIFPSIPSSVALIFYFHFFSEFSLKEVEIWDTLKKIWSLKRICGKITDSLKISEVFMNKFSFYFFFKWSIELLWPKGRSRFAIVSILQIGRSLPVWIAARCTFPSMQCAVQRFSLQRFGGVVRNVTSLPAVNLRVHFKLSYYRSLRDAFLWFSHLHE